MPLFTIKDAKLEKHISKPIDLERDIQRLIEQNMKEALDIDFIASEYSIQGGRMDSLGLDQSGNPVIIEYKKGSNSSIISQIAYYYTWLVDHKEAFEKLVHKAGIEREVRWESPRLICVSENFNFYDYSAIKVLMVRVELLKYRLYEDNLLYLTADRPVEVEERLTGKEIKKTVLLNEVSHIGLEEFLGNIPSPERRKLFEDMREITLELSSDIEEKISKTSVSFRTSINLCIVSPLKGNEITVYFPNSFLNPQIIEAQGLKEGKSESTMKLTSTDDLSRFKTVVQHIYETSL